MLGLPTETEEDILAIAELCEKVAERYYDIPKEQRNGKCQITASSSFFVPKPFTPFQSGFHEYEGTVSGKSPSAEGEYTLSEKSEKHQIQLP